MSHWRSFKPGTWQTAVDVRDFIDKNYTEYVGSSSFLVGPIQSSLTLNKRIFDLLEEEKQKGGVIELDTDVVASMTSHAAGYIDQSLEKIVGLQTDKPFKRAFHPYGGIQVATKAAEAYGYHIKNTLNMCLRNTVKHIIKVFLMCITEISVKRDVLVLLQDYLMDTDVVVSSVIIEELLYMVLIS